MNLQAPLHSSGKYIIICFCWICLNLLTLLFCSCSFWHFLVLLSSFLSPLPKLLPLLSCQTLMCKKAGATQQQPMKVVSRQSGTGAEGRDSAEGNHSGGGSAGLRLISKVVQLPPCCGPRHPPARGGRQGGFPAARQSRAGASLSHWAFLPLVRLCLPGWRSLLILEWFVLLSILLTLFRNPPWKWRNGWGAHTQTSLYVHLHRYNHVAHMWKENGNGWTKMFEELI